jgi:hypothetical protein
MGWQWECNETITLKVMVEMAVRMMTLTGAIGTTVVVVFLLVAAMVLLVAVLGSWFLGL